MGYFTYRIFRDLDAASLLGRVRKNLALYPHDGPAATISVDLVEGDGCAALLFSGSLEEQLFRPIGYQTGGVWMDVRYQDGDSWDLSLLMGFEQLANHSVNPWAYDESPNYNQKGIDYRIEKICSSWPRQGQRLRPYLLPWKYPKKILGIEKLVDREGKAMPQDRFVYGDAHQIYDFLAHFGFSDSSLRTEITHPEKEN